MTRVIYSQLVIRNCAAAAFCFAVLPSTPAQAETGVRVLLQAWNPMTPDEVNVITLVDQPGLVSNSLADAWVEAHPKICDEIKKGLAPARPAGQQLRDVTCILGAPTLTFAGTNQSLRGTFTMTGYLEATSTTPDPLGSYADPRFSVAFKAKLDLSIAVQPNPDQTLQITRASFTLSDAEIDSHNAVADVIQFVVEDLIPFFGGPDYKRFAENAVNGVSMQLASRFNAALAPVNAKLKGPSDAVRVGVSANADYVTVAFGPREFTPPANGRATGTLRWNASQFIPRNGCQSFGITATVQTGPVPLLTANAEAPRRRVGQFQASPAGPDSCNFTMTGLAAGWPNILTARVTDEAGARGAGNALYSVSYSLVGEGWDGRTVVPQPVASNRNYAVSRALDATGSEVADLSSAIRVAQRRTDPLINPADNYATRVRRGTDATLNPQPLPPVPDDDRASSDVVGARSTNAGIIIVSGQDGASPTPRVRVAEADDTSDLAAKGAVLSSEDPVTALLRDRQPTDVARRAFDVGLGAAEGQTEWGPGKERRANSFPPEGARAFRLAAEYSVDRNRNAARLAIGSLIVQADPELFAAREVNPDPRFWLGFDIATAIFGDPRQGAQGNTALGPGSLGIRAALSDLGKQGFDAAVKLHLSRKYAP